MSDTPPKSGFAELLTNLRELPHNVAASVSRSSTMESTRGRSQSVFGNVFLHIHSVRTHRWSLRPRFTMGLGVASGMFFLMLLVSGAVLMVHYVPSVDGAYNSVKTKAAIAVTPLQRLASAPCRVVASCPTHRAVLVLRLSCHQRDGRP